jgi:hypothetical protein
VTKAGLDQLNELDIPMKNQANEALGMLSDFVLDELIRLLGDAGALKRNF